MTSCMRPSRNLDNPPVFIACSLRSVSSVWCCSSLAAHALLRLVRKWCHHVWPLVIPWLFSYYYSVLNLLFKHRQEIAGWVFKPRNLRTPAAENPLFVCHQVSLIVGLEMHAMPGQVVYSLLNVVDRKIQDGECGRSMVILRIHQDVCPPSDMEL